MLRGVRDPVRWDRVEVTLRELPSHQAAVPG